MGKNDTAINLTDLKYGVTAECERRVVGPQDGPDVSPQTSAIRALTACLRFSVQSACYSLAIRWAVSASGTKPPLGLSERTAVVR